MKRTIAAWGVWFGGVGTLFVIEYFRIASEWNSLRWIPNWSMMLAYLVVTGVFIWWAYQGTQALDRRSIRVGVTLLQVLLAAMIHYVAGQFAMHRVLLFD